MKARFFLRALLVVVAVVGAGVALFVVAPEPTAVVAVLMLYLLFFLAAGNDFRPKRALERVLRWRVQDVAIIAIYCGLGLSLAGVAGWTVAGIVFIILPLSAAVLKDRPKFSLRTLFIVATLSAVAVSAFVAVTPPSVPWRSIELVQVGMTGSDVQELLGRPEQIIVVGKEQQLWHYRTGSAGEWSCEVGFDRGSHVTRVRYWHWGRMTNAPPGNRRRW